MVIIRYVYILKLVFAKILTIFPMGLGLLQLGSIQL